MTIHVLTLTWNGLDKLKRLKDGLIKNLVAIGQSARWYIRSNGCTDGTKEWLESWSDPWLEMKPFFVDHNRDNFSKGVNSLAELAKNDWMPNVKSRSAGLTRASFPHYFLLLNNDIVFDDDVSLSKMFKLINSDINIQMVGAKLLYNDTNKLQHAGVIFGPRYGNMPYHYRHGEISDKDACKNRYFQAVTAACCLLNAQEFFNVDRLDQNMNWAFEDVDLSLKFGQTWKIAYCGETNIFHEESATLKKNPVNKLFLQQNVKYFKDKWFGRYELDHDKYLNDKNYNIIK